MNKERKMIKTKPNYTVKQNIVYQTTNFNKKNHIESVKLLRLSAK